MDDQGTKFVYQGVYSEFTALPGSDGVVVLHNVWLAPELRGEGRGGRAHKARLAHVTALGYRYALCTVNKQNRAERHILEQNNWHKVSAFTNPWDDKKAVVLMGRHLTG